MNASWYKVKSINVSMASSFSVTQIVAIRPPPPKEGRKEGRPLKASRAAMNRLLPSSPSSPPFPACTAHHVSSRKELRSELMT